MTQRQRAGTTMTDASLQQRRHPTPAPRQLALPLSEGEAVAVDQPRTPVDEALPHAIAASHKYLDGVEARARSGLAMRDVDRKDALDDLEQRRRRLNRLPARPGRVAVNPDHDPEWDER